MRNALVITLVKVGDKIDHSQGLEFRLNISLRPYSHETFSHTILQ